MSFRANSKNLYLFRDKIQFLLKKYSPEGVLIVRTRGAPMYEVVIIRNRIN